MPPSSSIRRTRSPTTTAASRSTAATISTAPSPTSRRPSSSTARSRSPSTIAATPTRASATTTSAIADLDQAIKLNGNNALAFNDRGLAYGAKGDLDRAIKDFDQAIAIDTKSAPSYTNRGVAYSVQGRHRSRARGLRAGDQAQSELCASRSTTAATRFYDKGDYDKAIESYNEAVKLNPADPAGLSQPRQRLCQQARHRPRHRRSESGDQAQRRTMRWPTTIAASPTARGATSTRRWPISTSRSSSTRRNPLAFYNRGLTLRNRGDLDRAIADFDRRDQAQPELHGRALRARQRLSDQARLRPRHRRSRPGDQAQAGSRGRLHRPRRWPMAPRATPTAPSPTSTQAIKLDPNDAPAFNNRGFAYRTKGDIARADADYEQAIKLDPATGVGLLQPRQRLLREARFRPRHRRLRCRR